MAPHVVVIDEQSTHVVDLEALEALALGALESEGVIGPAELAVRFVDAVTIAALNEQFLGHEGPTDVLSFPIEDDPRRVGDGLGPPVLLGDVVICPEVAAANAREHAGSYEDELALLLVHGILHLLGMDHDHDDEAEEMEARERAILGRFVRPEQR